MLFHRWRCWSRPSRVTNAVQFGTKHNFTRAYPPKNKNGNATRPSETRLEGENRQHQHPAEHNSPESIACRPFHYNRLDFSFNVVFLSTSSSSHPHKTCAYLRFYGSPQLVTATPVGDGRTLSPVRNLLVNCVTFFARAHENEMRSVLLTVSRITLVYVRRPSQSIHKNGFCAWHTTQAMIVI